MYKGEPTNGKKLYDLLLKSDEFTSELDRVILTFGRVVRDL